MPVAFRSLQLPRGPGHHIRHLWNLDTPGSSYSRNLDTTFGACGTWTLQQSSYRGTWTPHSACEIWTLELLKEPGHRIRREQPRQTLQHSRDLDTAFEIRTFHLLKEPGHHIQLVELRHSSSQGTWTPHSACGIWTLELSTQRTWTPHSAAVEPGHSSYSEDLDTTFGACGTWTLQLLRGPGHHIRRLWNLDTAATRGTRLTRTPHSAHVEPGHSLQQSSYSEDLDTTFGACGTWTLQLLEEPGHHIRRLWNRDTPATQGTWTPHSVRGTGTLQLLEKPRHSSTQGTWTLHSKPGRSTYSRNLDTTSFSLRNLSTPLVQSLKEPGHHL